MIGFLFWKQDLLKPLFSSRINTITMLAITIFSFGFQWYTLTYLPVVDCLPFKKGNNISEKMQMPANFVPDSTVITFVYKKDGKEIEFTADKFPDDFTPDTYEFVKRFDKVVRKGKNNEPPIKGFVLSGETNVDSTTFILEQPYAVLLFCEKFSNAGSGWKENFEEVYRTASSKNISCYIVTAEPAEAKKIMQGTNFSDIPVFKCDYKAIQTASRSDLTIYLLKQGNVLEKFSGKSLGKMNGTIKDIPVQQKQVTVPVVEPGPDTTGQ
jgi:hypothetical protein